MLGYLLAGVLIGPFVLGFVGEEGQDLMHTAEFGVVMMLFLIGLELNPQSFWNMRRAIIGMGVSQVALTAVVLCVLLVAVFHLPLHAAIVVGLAFSMSSTAIVLQTLKEKGLTRSQSGQASFAVLLLQDVAVIPILALLPLLASSAVVSAIAGVSNDVFSGVWLHTFSSAAVHPLPYQALGISNEASGGFTQSDGMKQMMVLLGAMIALVVASRYLINPLLRLIARLRMRELFTTSALAIVVGVAALMEVAGLSPALGAFMAGVLLANSEYRHELESDVEPFKGLLLGLFFTAVGSTMNFHLMMSSFGTIMSLVIAVMVLKALVLLMIGWRFRLTLDQRLLFAVLLAQVGEFAFVLLSSARQFSLLSHDVADLCMGATTITMALSPLFIAALERMLLPRIGTTEKPSADRADNIEEHHKVIIAGFGHFGSTVGRFLRANGVQATILDNDSDRVDLLRKMGFTVYYGDCTRVDLLKSAGAEEASLLVSALDSEEQTALLVEVVKKHFPHLQVFMRAKNRFHTYNLLSLGLQKTYRESLHSSVYMGVDVLTALGKRRYTVTRKALEFIRYDEEALERLVKEWGNQERYILSVREEIALQEKLLSEDAQFLDSAVDNAWDSEPLRSAVRPPMQEVKESAPTQQ